MVWAGSLGSIQFLWTHGIPDWLPRLTPKVINASLTLEDVLRRTFPAAPSVPASERSPGFDIPSYSATAAFRGNRTASLELLRMISSDYKVPPFALSSEYAHTHGPRYNCTPFYCAPLQLLTRTLVEWRRVVQMGTISRWTAASWHARCWASPGSAPR